MDGPFGAEVAFEKDGLGQAEEGRRVEQGGLGLPECGGEVFGGAIPPVWASRPGAAGEGEMGPEGASLGRMVGAVEGGAQPANEDGEGRWASSRAGPDDGGATGAGKGAEALNRKRDGACPGAGLR